jgi:tetratricopeptide (TPR) repeat protein
VTAEQARRLLAQRKYAQARELALLGLEEEPHDVDLLRIAGRAGVELGAPDAVDQLRRVAESRPCDPDGWHDLAEALVAEGRAEDAAAALRRAVRLRSDDSGLVAELGRAEYAAGHQHDALSTLGRAVDLDPSNPSAVVSLAYLLRREGRLEAALDTAESISEGDRTGSVELEIAEINLALGRFEAAAAAYARLRAAERDEAHEVYVLHGLIDVAIRANDWHGALAYALQAAGADSSRRTGQLLEFVAYRVFGSLDRRDTGAEVAAALDQILNGDGDGLPTREEIDATLETSRTEHRLLHLSLEFPSPLAVE